MSEIVPMAQRFRAALPSSMRGDIAPENDFLPELLDLYGLPPLDPATVEGLRADRAHTMVADSRVVASNARAADIDNEAHSSSSTALHAPSPSHTLSTSAIERTLSTELEQATEKNRRYELFQMEFQEDVLKRLDALEGGVSRVLHMLTRRVAEEITPKSKGKRS